MTLQEAILSGKRFRRTGWVESGAVSPDYWTYAARGSFTLLTEDILADDWEVEEKQVTITESHFESAAARATQSFSIYNPPYIYEYLTQLKKELGL